MDPEECARLQQDFVRQLLADAPAEWAEIRATLVCLGGWAKLKARVLQEGDLSRMGGHLAGVVGMDLQEAMLEPGKGTWLSMQCVVEKSLAYHFTFNYDGPLPLEEGEQPDDETWEREFTDHPRPWDLIPDFSHVKQAFTEQEWEQRRDHLAAERAALRAQDS